MYLILNTYKYKYAYNGLFLQYYSGNNFNKIVFKYLKKTAFNIISYTSFILGNLIIWIILLLHLLNISEKNLFICI